MDFSFLSAVGKLKTQLRSGWLFYLPDSAHHETVAGHSFRVGIMAMFSQNGLNKEKCIKMALVHDLCEAFCGDLVLEEWLSPEQRLFFKKIGKSVKSRTDEHKLEFESLKLVLGTQNDSNLKEIQELWLEYEDQQTPESKFIKELDKLEMLVQAKEYEMSHPKLDLTEFFTTAIPEVTNKSLIPILEKIRPT